jgi:hypothetical protein
MHRYYSNLTARAPWPLEKEKRTVFFYRQRTIKRVTSVETYGMRKEYKQKSRKLIMSQGKKKQREFEEYTIYIARGSLFPLSIFN